MWNEMALWLAFLVPCPTPSSLCRSCTAVLVKNWRYILLEKRLPEWDEKPSSFSLSLLFLSSYSALSSSNPHLSACVHTGMQSFQWLSLHIKRWSRSGQLLAQQRSSDPICKNTLWKKPHTETSLWVTEWVRWRESCLVTYNWIPQHP